jgi:hypothetical protein
LKPEDSSSISIDCNFWSADAARCGYVAGSCWQYDNVPADGAAAAYDEGEQLIENRPAFHFTAVRNVAFYYMKHAHRLCVKRTHTKSVKIRAKLLKQCFGPLFTIFLVQIFL